MEFSAPGEVGASEAPPTNPRGLRLDRVPPPPAPPVIEQAPVIEPIERGIDPIPRAVEPVEQSPLEAAVDELDLQPEIIDLDEPAGDDVPDAGSTTAGRDGTGGEYPAGRRRPVRLLVIAAVCCLLGTTLGGGLALLDRTAVDQQRRASPLLDAAGQAVQQVQLTAAPLDVDRAVGQLQRIVTLDAAVRGSTGGFAWQLARRTVRQEPLNSTGNRAAGLALVAEAAVPLQSSLRAIGAPGAASPDALDTLARDLNRFASVSIRAEQLGTWSLPATPLTNASGGTAFTRLATAAAILPTMAGSPAPLQWLICRSATSGCTRVRLDAGRVTAVDRVTPAERSGRDTADSRDTADNDDITLTGARPRDLLNGRAVSVPGVLNLLVATGNGEDDGTPVATSAVRVEQYALDVLAGRRPGKGAAAGSRGARTPTSTHA